MQNKKVDLEKAIASNSLAYYNIADETFSTQPSDLSDLFLATCLINEINSSLFRLHNGWLSLRCHLPPGIDCKAPRFVLLLWPVLSHLHALWTPHLYSASWQNS